MPKQFVRVIYPTSRLVYVDDEQSGETNRVFGVGQGTHTFDLGPRHNYAPASRTVKVEGTTSTSPLELRFKPLEDA